MFAGVLLDLDGVLVESAAAIESLWRAVAARHGRTLSARALHEHVLGCSAEHTVAALFADLPARVRDDILADVRDAEPSLGFTEIEGARRLLAELAATGVPVALVTGATAARADRALLELGAGRTVRTMVTWGEAARGKPAPDCYRLAAQRLGVPPTDCLAVEDSPSGVRSAVAAGAAVLGVGDRQRLLAAGARWTADALTAVRFRPDSDGVALVLASTVEAPS